MGISVGAHVVAGDSATDTTTTGSVTTAASGSSFLIGCLWPHSDTVVSVGDNKGNTFVAQGSVTDDPGDGFKAQWYLCTNGTGGTGHTFNLKISSTDPKALFVIEITGGATSSLVDGTPSGALDTSSPFDSPVTTTNANDLIATLVASSGSTAVITFNGGFTALNTDTSFTSAATATQVVSATGTYSPAATTTTGLNAIVITIALKASAVGNVTITPTVGSDTISGNTPTVTPANNTILFPVTAERRSDVTPDLSDRLAA